MKVKGQTTGLIISLHKMVCRWLFHCTFAMRLKTMVFKRAHLLWHTTSVDNGHLQGPLALTPVAERLAVELSLPFLATSGLSRLGFEHQTFLIRDGIFQSLYCKDIFPRNSIFPMPMVPSKHRFTYFQIHDVFRTQKARFQMADPIINIVSDCITQILRPIKPRFTVYILCKYSLSMRSVQMYILTS